VYIGGELPGMEMLRNLIANPLTIPLAAFISFMSGPWSEEFGWRGFALDRIIKPLGVIPGTIVLGVVWGGVASALVLHVQHLAWRHGISARRLLDLRPLQRWPQPDYDLGIPEYESQHPLWHAAPLHLELHLSANRTIV
jgi:hypothetical protein